VLLPAGSRREFKAFSHNVTQIIFLPDEDTIMDHADFECLSWKEILSLIDDYYKVNSFLIEKNDLISPNYILPKAMYYVVFRYVICQDIASGGGRRSRDMWRSSLDEHEHVMAH
jgi:hypothetical protein